MGKKKSGKKAAQRFKDEIERLEQFAAEIDEADLTDQAKTWAYEAALIKTAVAFEHLMLDCIVTAINNDTTTISTTSGVGFPKHLTYGVCEYLVTGGRYFDFQGGRSGLIKEIKKYVPDDHWLVNTIKNIKYAEPLDRMIALRNFAAHESPHSKRLALKAISRESLGSAGSWLKRQKRFHEMASTLKQLAGAIEEEAPY